MRKQKTAENQKSPNATLRNPPVLANQGETLDIVISQTQRGTRGVWATDIRKCIHDKNANRWAKTYLFNNSDAAIGKNFVATQRTNQNGVIYTDFFIALPLALKILEQGAARGKKDYHKRLHDFLMEKMTTMSMSSDKIQALIEENQRLIAENERLKDERKRIGVDATIAKIDSYKRLDKQFLRTELNKKVRELAIVSGLSHEYIWNNLYLDFLSLHKTMSFDWRRDLWSAPNKLEYITIHENGKEFLNDMIILVDRQITEYKTGVRA